MPASSSVCNCCEDDGLALVGLALGAARLADGGLDPFQALLDDREVGEGEFEVQGLDVAQGIDRVLGVGHVGVGEGADDVDEGLPLGQVAEQLPAEALLGDALRQPGDIDVLHVGGDDLLGLEDACQHVQAAIGDLDGRQIRLVLGGGISADGGFGTGQGVEDGRLAAARQADDDQAE